MHNIVPDDPRITLIHLEGPINIGDKRNYGCARAAGDFIAHWDDDDWSAPERLSEQLRTLTASGRNVTGYNSMRFTDGPRRWQYRGTPGFALGTSLLYRKDWWRNYPFLSLQIGEDNHFATYAAQHGQLEAADAGRMMYATIHAGNTSPRTRGSAWTPLGEDQWP